MLHRSHEFARAPLYSILITAARRLPPFMNGCGRRIVPLHAALRAIVHPELLATLRSFSLLSATTRGPDTLAQVIIQKALPTSHENYIFSPEFDRSWRV